MGNYNLGFISNEDIYEHVRNTAMQYRTAIDLKSFNANIIDPIKLTFDSKVYGKEFEDIIEAECIRQIDKTNSNRIGYFHQNIFKYAGNGWKVPTAGFDVINEQMHIYVILRNNYNSLDSASSRKIYINMQNKLLSDDKAICMLVEVVAKKSQNIKWIISGNECVYSNERIRLVSMDYFYEIVFGDEEAFAKLCKALPSILDDVVQEFEQGGIENEVGEDSHKIDQDPFKGLFLLAFGTYKGFNKF